MTLTFATAPHAGSKMHTSSEAHLSAAAPTAGAQPQAVADAAVVSWPAAGHNNDIALEKPQGGVQPIATGVSFLLGASIYPLLYLFCPAAGPS